MSSLPPHRTPFFYSLVFVLTTFHLPWQLPALPVLPDPDPATIQTQTQTFHRAPPATIPAFPEQAEISACPLDLPEELFHGIKSACASKPHHRSDPNFYSGELHRSRCCPVLAAWLYSAYSRTGLRASAAKAPRPETAAPFDMPVLPDDSETCVDALEKALDNKGVQLRRPNETCDVVFCYCGIRLHPFSCPESFSVNSGGQLEGGKAVKKLERDCSSNGGLGGCSKCLTALHLLNGDKAGRSNRTERTSKMHNRDCELMGLTWLLNKDRPAYIHTVSAVLRSLMMSTNADSDNSASDPMYCSLNSDGMPLAVDSSEINDQSSSSFWAMPMSSHPYHSFLHAGLVLLLAWY
ncbi:uncharacterized GPI-anchored protein At4g28100 [Andrographis paniculata]|uniref:uncharacterized GPI-anchored protein At4g28100 n=1 Tax=Andrographis paniculata TaxID=175694 RepID=UPI0021E93F9F|nr:uncharacterized GPI-anchored protein At4g28100 [Andrographis paniculata]